VNPPDDRELGVEFQLFARHLTRVGGTSYQESKYIEAHHKLDISPRERFDWWLYGVARSGMLGIWLTDAYTGLLARKSMVRSKLVLTLALLECAPSSFVELDRPDRGGLWLALLSTAMRGIEFAFALLLGAVIFGPAQLWFAAKGSRL
jgi:hypothetical protein